MAPIILNDNWYKALGVWLVTVIAVAFGLDVASDLAWGVRMAAAFVVGMCVSRLVTKWRHWEDAPRDQD